MFAALLVALALVGCSLAAGTPGVPIFLEVPLNLTAFPNGYSASTTRAANYQITPIDQIAFFVPLNASSVTLRLVFPNDDNNNYFDYDYGFQGPLCQYVYQRATYGYTCGGLDDIAYKQIPGSFNYTFTPAGVNAGSSSGYRWEVGKYFYFGIMPDDTADNTTVFPLSYTVSSIEIATCPPGTVGGATWADGNPVCIPLVQLPSNGSANFFYNGNFTGATDGMAFETVVPANAGLMQATITIPNTVDISSYEMYGATMGVPNADLYDCSDTSSEDTGADTITITWTCKTPVAGRFYFTFRVSETGNFTGTVALNYSMCTGMKAGLNCLDNFMDLGNVASANNITRFSLDVPAYNTTQLRLFVPMNTSYNFNVTFSTNYSSTYVYAKANGYASRDSSSGYVNTNWYINPDSTTPDTFVFQAGSNFMGETLFFFVDSLSYDATINVTVVTEGAVVPTSSNGVSSSASTSSGTNSRSSSSSATGTRSSSSSATGTRSSSSSGTRSSSSSASTKTGTTTAANSDSTMLVACVLLSVIAALLF